MISSIFGLLYAVKLQYILNLTHVWLYFGGGGGNMATAAFFRDLRAWDWSFSSSFPHRHCQFPSSLNPQFSFQGWCRRRVFCCEGDRTHLNGDETLFMFSFLGNSSALLHIIVLILECVWCWYESCLFFIYFLFVCPLAMKKGFTSAVALEHGEATSASDEFTGGEVFVFRLVVLHAARPPFQSLPVNNVTSHSTRVFRLL